MNTKIWAHIRKISHAFWYKVIIRCENEIKTTKILQRSSKQYFWYFHFVSNIFTVLRHRPSSSDNHSLYAIQLSLSYKKLSPFLPVKEDIHDLMVLIVENLLESNVAIRNLKSHRRVAMGPAMSWRICLNMLMTFEIGHEFFWYPDNSYMASQGRLTVIISSQNRNVGLKILSWLISFQAAFHSRCPPSAHWVLYPLACALST